MYIIYETVAGDDPRVTPEIEFVGSVWHYTISYISPENESEVFLKWLKPTEISEAVAKAYKFVASHEGEVNLKVPVDLNGDGFIDEIELATSQSEKIPYFLTADDDKNTSDLLKAIMKNHIDKHLEDAATKTRLLEIIDAAQTLLDTQIVMATYFDFDVAATANMTLVKEVEVPWSTL